MSTFTPRRTAVAEPGWDGCRQSVHQAAGLGARPGGHHPAARATAGLIGVIGANIGAGLWVLFGGPLVAGLALWTLALAAWFLAHPRDAGTRAEACAPAGAASSRPNSLP